MNGSLPFKRFGRAARRKIVILVQSGFNDLREQFSNCWQPIGCSAIPIVLRLTQNELPAVSRVTDVQPIGAFLEEGRADDAAGPVAGGG